MLAMLCGLLHAQAIEFGGYTWEVRSGSGGPGPNTFVASNVSLDANGYLHLKISHDKSKWTTAEVFTDVRLGFGTYQFKIIGRPDLLDTNVVLGLFNYTTPDVGPDGTNEIDIEFATWGDPTAEHGNWTVWPAVQQSGINATTYSYDTTLTGDTSTHRFQWTSRQVYYESLYGLSDDEIGLFRTWTFAPADYVLRVPQHPLPVHMNLWLLNGHAPTNGQDVDITIAEFRYIPDCLFSNGFDDPSTICT
ncbi:MAG TPA: glycoside hydrolase family 16 protein [Rudaea sp.]|nr:glycoside hydrolase family 16 protein [Rudaea sp.]